MSGDHANRGFLPPSTANTTDELHRQSPSSATFPTGETILRFTASPLPQTSPMTPKTTSHANNTAAELENTTPESQIAAALGRAINSIPATSFRDAVAATTTAVNTQNPLRRTISDASSSDYTQLSTITTTPLTGSEPPRITPLHRTLSDANSSDYRQPSTIITTPPKAPEPATRTPLRRTVSAPIPIHQQQPAKTVTPPPVARTVFPATIPRTTAPESLNRKESPGFKRLRKIEETVRGIEQRCWDVMQECESGVAEEHIEEENSFQAMAEEQVDEECVACERLSDGGLTFRLRCSCGKGFNIFLKDNGSLYKPT